MTKNTHKFRCIDGTCIVEKGKIYDGYYIENPTGYLTIMIDVSKTFRGSQYLSYGRKEFVEVSAEKKVNSLEAMVTERTFNLLEIFDVLRHHDTCAAAYAEFSKRALDFNSKKS